MALKQTRFTLIELLIVTAIIAMLAALLLPALARTKFQAKTVVCLNDQKQWGEMLLMYAADNSSKFYNEGSSLNPSVHDIPESFEPTFADYGANEVSRFFCIFRRPEYADAKWLEGAANFVDFMGFGYWVERPGITAKQQGGYGSYAKLASNSADDMLWSDTVWMPTKSIGPYPAGVFNGTWATRHSYDGVKNMNVLFADGHGVILQRPEMMPVYKVQSAIYFYGELKK